MRYYNLTNSHWEPFIEPWAFQVKVIPWHHVDSWFLNCVQASRGDQKSGFSASLSSKQRLEVDLTATFIETAMTTMSAISKDDKVLKRTRGTDDPFLVCNRTGYRINLWTDAGSRDRKVGEAVKIEDGHDCPWRFGDWRTMREVSPSI